MSIEYKQNAPAERFPAQLRVFLRHPWRYLNACSAILADLARR